jgi:hypothetical protein
MLPLKVSLLYSNTCGAALLCQRLVRRLTVFHRLLVVIYIIRASAAPRFPRFKGQSDLCLEAANAHACP